MNITIEDLLKNAVHFGHRTQKWNPKMKPYIAGASKGIHIFDVEQTKEKLETALAFITKSAQEGKRFLLIGTKFQASEMIASVAKELGIPYVNHKWIAGLLTNFETVRRRIKYLKNIQEMETTGEIEKYTKKEQGQLKKEKEDLLYSLGGVKDMEYLPEVVIIIDVFKERLALREAQKLGLDVVALVDSNGDPDNISYPIPGNDDAIKALTYIMAQIKDAYLAGQHRRPAKKVMENEPNGKSMPEKQPVQQA